MIDRFLKYMEASRGVSPCTVYSYRASLEDLQKYVLSVDAELGWTTIDRDIIRLWLADGMNKGRSPRTLTAMLAAVHTFYRYLLSENVVQRDPSHGVRAPKADKPLPVFLKEAQVNYILDEYAYGDDYVGVRNHTIMLMLCHTGVRASELLGLNLVDVDVQQGELKVTGKRNKQRIVPFGEELAKGVKEYLHSRSLFVQDLPSNEEPLSDVLFLNRNGRPMNYSELHDVVVTVLSQVSTQHKRSPHVLRHTFATLMLNNGADLESIQRLLGHESLGTTEVYTHTTFAELRKQYAQAHPRA